MARTRYIGSNRPREGGISATTKQDFISHVTGGDWIHLASQISVTGSYGNVQAELDALESFISGNSNVVVNAGGSDDNAVAIFSGTTGKQLKQSAYPLKLDAVYGDLWFPADTGFNLITVTGINSEAQGQSLNIMGQNNQGGKGGNLVLGCGFNSVLNTYDADISLVASKMLFDSAITDPIIGQREISSSSAASNLTISAQSNLSLTGTPGNLWLSSGVNGVGAAGNIFLFSYPNTINIISSGIVFDTSIYPASPIINQQDASTGDGFPFYISAQNTANGTGGTLWLSSGTGSSGNHGNINLNAQGNGDVNIYSSLLNFDSLQLNPIITQGKADTSIGNDLKIIAQSNVSGTPGNLWLQSGSSDTLMSYGAVNIVANSGGISLYSNILSFDALYSDIKIYQKDRDIVEASDMTIAAQSIPVGATNSNGIPGDLLLESGYNPNNSASGRIYLYSNSSPTVLLTSALMFGSSFTNPSINQEQYSLGAPYNTDAQILRVVAQRNTNGRGGDLWLLSGSGYTDSQYQPNVPGDSGDINIDAGFGQVTISGTSFNGSAGVNIVGPLFISEGAAFTPLGGVLLFVSGGALFWRDGNGVDHAL